MDSKVAFCVIKNVIIEQNKELLKLIAQKHNLDYDMLMNKYLTPEYYLPVVQTNNSKKQNSEK
jgi:hypothetical protein